jgi:hypothetical protein
LGLGGVAEKIAQGLNDASTNIPLNIMNQNNNSGNSIAEQYGNIDAWMKKNGPPPSVGKPAEFETFKTSDQQLCASSNLLCTQTGNAYDVVCSPSVTDARMPSGRRSLGVVGVTCSRLHKGFLPTITGMVALQQYQGVGRVPDRIVGRDTIISSFLGDPYKSYCEPCKGELVDCGKYFWSPVCLAARQ